jgi:hypothetical protein
MANKASQMPSARPMLFGQSQGQNDGLAGTSQTTTGLPAGADREVAAVPEFLSSAFQMPASLPASQPARSGPVTTGFHQVGQEAAPESQPGVIPSAPGAAAGVKPAAEATPASDGKPAAAAPGPADTRAAKDAARHDKKTGRILPWFLQDNDSRPGE